MGLKDIEAFGGRLEKIAAGVEAAIAAEVAKALASAEADAEQVRAVLETKVSDLEAKLAAYTTA